MLDALDNATVLAAGRRFRAACDRFDSLERTVATLKDTSPDRPAVVDRADRAAEERAQLELAVFRRVPESLPDVAVLAAHALHQVHTVSQLDLEYLARTGSLRTRLARLEIALAGILTVTAKAGGVGLSEIGWPGLGRIVRDALALRAVEQQQHSRDRAYDG